MLLITDTQVHSRFVRCSVYVYLNFLLFVTVYRNCPIVLKEWIRNNPGENIALIFAVSVSEWNSTKQILSTGVNICFYGR